MTEPAAPADEAFYSGALDRIRRFTVVLSIALTVALWIARGWHIGLGFLVGAAIAYVNFHWLKRAVTALADRVTATGQSESGRGVFVRFLLRYLLIAVVGYAIFRFSRESLYGLLAGLFVPVAAIACEAAYELYIALRRGI